MSWLAKAPSKVAVETEISPNGEPPFGGSTIPSTWSWSSSPVGVSTVRGDPTASEWSSAYRLTRKAPSRPSSAGTLLEPLAQVMLITFVTFASTPVTTTVLPSTLASPERISDTASTPGVVAAAWAASLVSSSPLFPADTE